MLYSEPAADDALIDLVVEQTTHSAMAATRGPRGHDPFNGAAFYSVSLNFGSIFLYFYSILLHFYSIFLRFGFFSVFHNLHRD